MTSEISVRRTFLRLLRSLRYLRNYLMRIRGPHMSLLSATFIHQDRLRSLWWDMITSIGTIIAVIQKWLLRSWMLMLRMRTNQKIIIVHEGLPENFSTDISKSKQNIVNKTLLQNNSMNVSEYTIAELKKGYKEPSDTKGVTSYFKIIECGRNFLDRHAVTYQRVFMATPQDK